MADLEDIHRSIGSLTAQVSEVARQNTAIFVKMDKMNEEQIEHRGAIKLLGQQLTDHKSVDAAIHTRVDGMEKTIEAVKNRGKGFVVGVTILGGGGGIAGIVAFLKAVGLA